MKQRIVYIVLLKTAMYLPASSRECAKVSDCPIVKVKIPVATPVVAATEEQDMLPASPAGRLLVNM